MNVLRDYFVLMRGNTLPCFDIKKILKNFQKMKIANTIPSLVMMRIFYKSQPLDSRRSKEENTCIMHDEIGIIKFYESIKEKKEFLIEENSRLSFKNIADMQIRYDLHDSFISICTP